MRGSRTPDRPSGRSGRSLLTYLLVCSAVVGCERSAETDTRTTPALGGDLIAVIGPGGGHPQWPGIRGGAERCFSGVPTIRSAIFTPSDTTSDSLLNTVTRVLDQHPTAVCLFVTDPVVARAGIERILAAQVLLVTMGARVDDPRIPVHVAVDLAGGAEQLGANLERIAAGRRSYVVVYEDAPRADARNVYLRFKEASRRQYDVTLLQALPATAGGKSQPEVVEELLARFTHAGLVVTLDPEAWLNGRVGWTHELRQRNAEFRFATLGAVPRLWRRLGTPAAPGDAAALVGPLDGEIGYAAVQAVVRMLLNPGADNSDRLIPCELVTAENLRDFARRYSAAANRLDVSAYLPTTAAPASEAAGK